RVGTVDQRAWDSQDAERITASGVAPEVWADPHTTLRSVKSLASTITGGTLVCTDGYTDREVCNVKITQVGVTVVYSNHTINDLDRGEQTSGLAAFSAGDSGAPVYALNSGGSTKVQGMLVARVSSNASKGWFEPWWILRDRLGISPIHTG